ncbi:hypothetical protein D9M69_602310 [compost metagenome]
MLHGFGQRNAAIGRFGQIAGAQAVRRKRLWIETGARGSCFDDCIDRLGIDRLSSDIVPSIDGAKQAAAFDLRRRNPSIERVDGATGQIDDLVMLGAGRLGASEVDRQSGEGGRAVAGDYGLFHGELFH